MITTTSLARRRRARRSTSSLAAAGWVVQSHEDANVSAGPGVAVREFVLEKGHGRVDYLLFVDGQPAGVIEAKPEGTTLVEVEHQSGQVRRRPARLDQAAGLPAALHLRVHREPRPGSPTATTPMPAAAGCSRSTGPRRSPSGRGRSRRDPEAPTFRARLRTHARARQPAALGGPGHGDPQP